MAHSLQVSPSANSHTADAFTPVANNSANPSTGSHSYPGNTNNNNSSSGGGGVGALFSGTRANNGYAATSFGNGRTSNPNQWNPALKGPPGLAITAAMTASCGTHLQPQQGGMGSNTMGVGSNMMGGYQARPPFVPHHQQQHAMQQQQLMTLQMAIAMQAAGYALPAPQPSAGPFVWDAAPNINAPPPDSSAAWHQTGADDCWR